MIVMLVRDGGLKMMKDFEDDFLYYGQFWKKTF